MNEAVGFDRVRFHSSTNSGGIRVGYFEARSGSKKTNGGVYSDVEEWMLRCTRPVTNVRVDGVASIHSWVLHARSSRMSGRRTLLEQRPDHKLRPRSIQGGQS